MCIVCTFDEFRANFLQNLCLQNIANIVQYIISKNIAHGCSGLQENIITSNNFENLKQNLGSKHKHIHHTSDVAQSSMGLNLIHCNLCKCNIE